MKKDNVIESDFENLYKENYIPLVQFADAILHRTEIAEDIVTDVFISIWKKKEELAHVTDIRNYLYRSVKNRALNHIDREKALQPIQENEGSQWLVLSTPETQLISAETLRQLNNIIQTMPPKCQMCFHLVKMEGFSYKEVAQILGISIRTVNAQMVIAVKIILKELKKNNFSLGIFLFLCVFNQ